MIMDTIRRGYIPKDAVEFGPKATEKLATAAQELAFLINRGYDTKSASTFVGNHHLLSERQRLALARIVSTDDALAARYRKELSQAPDTIGELIPHLGKLFPVQLLLTHVGPVDQITFGRMDILNGEPSRQRRRIAG